MLKIFLLFTVFIMILSCYNSLLHGGKPIFRKFNRQLTKLSPAESIFKGEFSAQDENFMRLALRHAQHAARENEIPIGAVIVDINGVVLAASRNRVEYSKDATAHAEIVCLREAAQLQDNWRLLDSTLYSTLEPCPMCLAAIQSFRVKRVVFGAKDVRLGACGSYINMHEFKHPFHNVNISGGLLSNLSESLLKRFFLSRRSKNSDIGEYCDRGTTDPTTT
jgi:tRNA(adenine34) deaminase